MVLSRLGQGDDVDQDRVRIEPKANVSALAGADSAADQSENDVTRRLEAAKKIPVPMPTRTPFDSDPVAARIYLQEFAAGYRNVAGNMGIHCHMCLNSTFPSARCEPYLAGWRDGSETAWNDRLEKRAANSPKSSKKSNDAADVCVGFGILSVCAAIVLLTRVRQE